MVSVHIFESGGVRFAYAGGREVVVCFLSCCGRSGEGEKCVITN